MLTKYAEKSRVCAGNGLLDLNGFSFTACGEIGNPYLSLWDQRYVLQIDVSDVTFFTKLFCQWSE